MSESLLAGWSRRFAAGGVVLVPPDAAAGRGLVRIHDREPRRPLAAVVRQLASGAPPGTTSRSTGPARS